HVTNARRRAKDNSPPVQGNIRRIPGGAATRARKAQMRLAPGRPAIVAEWHARRGVTKDRDIRARLPRSARLRVRGCGKEIEHETHSSRERRRSRGGWLHAAIG